MPILINVSMPVRCICRSSAFGRWRLANVSMPPGIVRTGAWATATANQKIGTYIERRNEWTSAAKRASLSGSRTRARGLAKYLGMATDFPPDFHNDELPVAPAVHLEGQTGG
jgi:hypothetical protein